MGARVGASTVAGLVAVGIAQGWLGVIGGDWLANAGVMVLVGNPLSAISSAPELLPQPAGAIGQLLPPGAGGSLLRSTAFFDGAGAGAPLTVLAVWVALGLAATWLGARRHRRTSQVVAAAADPVAVP